jgi:MFS family permease
LKLKNISRQVVILGMVSFFTDFASEMLYPVTPIFLTSLLGASMAVVGIIEGVAEVTAGFLKGYFGSLSDKVGKRSIFIMIGYGLSGLVKSLPGFLAAIPVVIFSRIGDRIGKGIRTAPRDALLSNYAKENSSGAVFGFHRSMDTLGAVIGPLVALILLGVFSFSYSEIYLVAIVPSFFAIFFTWLVKDVKTKQKSSSKKIYSEFWKAAPAQYKRLLILFTLFSFANSSDVFLILKSKQVTHSDITSILGYIFYNLVYALASFPLGIISDKLGKKKMLVTGMFTFSVVYLGFALNSNFYFTWILFALYGIYAAATEGISKAWVSDLVPAEFRGSAIGLLTMLSSFAIMFGSFFAGILWDKFGAAVPFIVSSLLAIVAAGLTAFAIPTGKSAS